MNLRQVLIIGLGRNLNIRYSNNGELPKNGKISAISCVQGVSIAEIISSTNFI